MEKIAPLILAVPSGPTVPTWTATIWSSVQFAPKTKHFELSSVPQILVRKVLSTADIQLALCGYRNCRLRPQSPNVRRGRSREALPLQLRLTPPTYTHLYGVKCTRRVDSQTQHGLPHIHPKMGSTVESRWRVRAAGKPSDEPLRKGETQSLTVIDIVVPKPNSTSDGSLFFAKGVDFN